MKPVPTYTAHIPGILPFKALDENLTMLIKADERTVQQRLLEIEYGTPRPRNNYKVTNPSWLIPDTDSVVVPLHTTTSLFHYYNKVRFILAEVIAQMGIFPSEEQFFYAFRAPERYLLTTRPRVQDLEWWETHSRL